MATKQIDMASANAAALFFTGVPPLADSNVPDQEEDTPKNEEQTESTGISTAKSKYKETVSKNGVKIGRPRKKKPSINFQLSCTPEYHDMLKELAASRDLSISEFIRECVDFYKKQKRL